MNFNSIVNIILNERDETGRAFRMVRDRRAATNRSSIYGKDYYNTIKKAQKAGNTIEREQKNQVRVFHVIMPENILMGPHTNKTLSREQQFINRLGFLFSKQDKEISVSVKGNVWREEDAVILTGIATDLLEHYSGDAGTNYPEEKGEGKNKYPSPWQMDTPWDEAVVNLQDVKWDGYINNLTKWGETGATKEKIACFINPNDPKKCVERFPSNNPQILAQYKQGILKLSSMIVTKGIDLKTMVDEFLSKKRITKYNTVQDLYKLRN